MFFSLSAEAFRDIIALAKSVIPRGTTLPVLKTLHCTVEPDTRTLAVRVTDLDIMVTRRFLLLEPGRPGTICLYLSRLSTVKPDKATPVRIDVIADPADAEWNAEALAVTGGHAVRTVLTCYNPADFPPDPPLPPADAPSTLLPPSTIKAIADSIPFQSEDETRYVLNGTYLDPAMGGTIVATDGRRLYCHHSRATPVGIIVPARACELLVRLAGHRGVRVDLDAEAGISGGTASFRTDPSTTLHTRLVAGNFPNWQQVVPQPTGHRITFSDPAAVAKFLRALPRQEKSDSVTLRPRQPSSVRIENGAAAATFSAFLEGDPPAIAFNPAFLSVCLDHVGGSLSLENEMSPGLFLGSTGRAVLMPMRVTTTTPAVPTP